jgi:hypothetical protein
MTRYKREVKYCQQDGRHQIPKTTPYRPIGRRPGLPLKRLLDGYSREAETGHLWAKLRDQEEKNLIVSTFLSSSCHINYMLNILCVIEDPYLSQNNFTLTRLETGAT